jgi:hypothetical protein
MNETNKISENFEVILNALIDKHERVISAVYGKLINISFEQNCRSPDYLECMRLVNCNHTTSIHIACATKSDE